MITTAVARDLVRPSRQPCSPGREAELLRGFPERECRPPRYISRSLPADDLNSRSRIVDHRESRAWRWQYRILPSRPRTGSGVRRINEPDGYASLRKGAVGGGVRPGSRTRKVEKGCPASADDGAQARQEYLEYSLTMVTAERQIHKGLRERLTGLAPVKPSDEIASGSVPEKKKNNIEAALLKISSPPLSLVPSKRSLPTRAARRTVSKDVFPYLGNHCSPLDSPDFPHLATC
ncbi:hypothetical protein GGS23DRAFT_566072 [Durotheca rogersii]|uniref:uncharacterized protein n=1 Tax=Durotheca rogersii TaxID=419775 RepID=UPI002220CEC3|nr:uncharacterized protein GGS23DRAFT_566072 [Durotheca rogersii]KAI5863947.1 hypothetical protein GGS23DRAFT_566072 [Durotheca rogersii]